jgi:hypothetical protein
MPLLLSIGPLSYAGIALIVFFILSFFFKNQNILTKTQTVQYQNLKLEVTLNILVFIAGIAFLYFDYSSNYQKLQGRFQEKVDTLHSLENKNKQLVEDLQSIKTITYDFLIRLEPIDSATTFPEPSDLECYYKETNNTPRQQAVVSESNGAEGTYKVTIIDIQDKYTIPFLEIIDKNKKTRWTIEDNIEIRPPLVDLFLKK